MLDSNSFLDERFYLSQSPDVAAAVSQGAFSSGFDHFQKFGQFERRNLNGLFAEGFYLSQYSDVAQAVASGVFKSGLDHFIQFGQIEGRTPSVFFEPNFYLGYYTDVDAAVASGQMTPIEHFVKFGQHEKRDPITEFYTDIYLEENADVAQAVEATAATADPLTAIEHLVNYGQYENRKFGPDFDPDYYLEQYPDVAAAVKPGELSAIKHYLRYGKDEGRLGTPPEEQFTFDAFDEVLPVIFGNSLRSDSLTDGAKDNPLRPGSFANDYSLTEITAGQTVRVSLSSSEFDPYLQLVNATTGELITENGNVADGNLNSELTFKADLGVEYLIRVTSTAGNATGNYTLTTSTSDPIVGSIAPNQSLNGSLSLDDLSNPILFGSFSDDYRLTGVSPDQQVQLNLNSPEFDTYLQLIDAATGEELAFNDDVNYPDNTNSELSFTVQSGVEYLVRVTSFGENVTGNYTLSATPTQRTIDVDEAVNGVLDSTDNPNPFRANSFSDDYALTGVSVGQQVRINLDSSELDTYLQLVNADTGQLIVENDDVDLQIGNFNSELNFTVQPGINYLIRVTSYADAAAGAYNLTTTDQSMGDWFALNLSDPGVQSVSRQQAADGVLDRNDMLTVFNEAGNDDSIIDGVELSDIRQLNENSIRFRMPEYVESLSRQVVENTTPGASAAQFQGTVGSFFLADPEERPPAVFNTTEKRVEKDANGNPLKDANGNLKYVKGVEDRLTIKFDYVPLEGKLFSESDASPNKGTRGTPEISHIDQGQFGDCVFLAVLGSTFGPQNEEIGQRSSIIENMIKDEGDGTYTVTFFVNGKAQPVTVDNFVLSPQENQKYQTGSPISSKDNQGNRILFGATADGHDSSKPDGSAENRSNNPTGWPIWVPILERAYAQFRQKYAPKEDLAQGRDPKNGWDIIGNGDNIYEPLKYITGRAVTYYLLPSGRKDQGPGKDTFDFEVLRNAIADSNGYVVASTPGTGQKESSSSGKGKSPLNDKLISSHAYSVTNAYVDEITGEQRVVVRNPWGRDNDYDRMTEGNRNYNPNSWSGDKWDGFIDLSFNEFITACDDVAITT